MKNRSIIYIGIVLMSMVILTSFYNVFNFSNYDYDNNIINKKWYNYDTETGYYNVFSLAEESVVYNFSSEKNIKNEFEGCGKYFYDKKSNKINFLCGKTIKIVENKKNKLVLEINNKKTIFFETPKETLNYEFESFYNSSVSEYKKKMSQTVELIRIDTRRIEELINEKDYSKLIFMGDGCTSIDCILVYDLLEKWISTSEDVYYINSDELKKEDVEFLYNLNNDFSKDVNEYRDIYPLVYVVSENKIIDKYNIKCDGFNCSKYNKL